MASIRAVGEPVDLMMALPKIGEPRTPYDYDAALRRRLGPTNQIGEQQNAYSSRKASERDAAAYLQSLQALRDQSAQMSSGGQHYGNIQWDGKKWISPAGKYGYSGTFGKYASGGEHNALDFLTPMGSPIYAPFSGTVVSSKYEGPTSPGAKYFGNALRIAFDNGTYGILGHLGSFANGIKPGMHLTPGQLVALSGNSGYSTGPHTHYEMRKDLYDPSTAFDYRYLFGW